MNFMATSSLVSLFLMSLATPKLPAPISRTGSYLSIGLRLGLTGSDHFELLLLLFLSIGDVIITESDTQYNSPLLPSPPLPCRCRRWAATHLNHNLIRGWRLPQLLSFGGSNRGMGCWEEEDDEEAGPDPAGGDKQRQRGEGRGDVGVCGAESVSRAKAEQVLLPLPPFFFSFSFLFLC